jgi:F0F1-type ATP synthase epsilon subunit
VILRTREGDASFLAGHTPLVGTVEPGVIRVVRAEGDEERVAVHGGFVQVEQGVSSADGVGSGGPGGRPSSGGSAGQAASGTRVTMLIGVAELAEEIDADRARAALERAEARVAELSGSGGRHSGGGSGSGGSGSGGGGEDEEPDADLVEAEAALLRAQVRLEAVDASAGVAGAG